MHRLLTLLGFLGITLVGWAQAPTTMEPEGALSVRLMSWSGDLTDLWLNDGGHYVPVHASEFVLRRPVVLKKRMSTLELSREVEVDGQTTRLTVAKVALPSGAESVLIVLAPAPAGGDLPLVGRALDESLEAHPLETLRVVNFSAKTVAIRVAESTKEIRSGGEWLVPFSDAGSLQLAVHVAVDDGSGGWVLVQSALQATPPGRRVLGIVRDGRPDMSIEDPALRTKPVEVIFLVDRAAPAPAESSVN